MRPSSGNVLTLLLLDNHRVTGAVSSVSSLFSTVESSPHLIAPSTLCFYVAILIIFTNCKGGFTLDIHMPAQLKEFYPSASVIISVFTPTK